MSQNKITSIVSVDKKYFHCEYTYEPFIGDSELLSMINKLILSNTNMTRPKKYVCDVLSKKVEVMCKQMTEEEIRFMKDSCNTVIEVDGRHFLCTYNREINYRPLIKDKIIEKIEDNLPFYGNYEITWFGETFYFTCKRIPPKDVCNIE